MSEIEEKVIAALKVSNQQPRELATSIGVDERPVREAIWRLIDRGEIKLTVDRKLTATDKSKK